MPAREWRLRVEDILEGVRRIQEFIAGMDLAAFSADEKTVDAAAASPDLPWADMRAMRNVVVHEYFGVTRETLWKTAREDLPGIVDGLRRLLAAQPA